LHAILLAHPSFCHLGANVVILCWSQRWRQACAPPLLLLLLRPVHRRGVRCFGLYVRLRGTGLQLNAVLLLLLLLA